MTRCIEILGEAQIQAFLERFAPCFPASFYLVNLAGEVVASSELEGQGGAGRHFVIDHNLQSVTLEGASAETPGVAAAPLLAQGELDGYVVGVSRLPAELPQHEYCQSALRIIAEWISEKTYSEYELQNLTEELVEKYNEVNLIYDIADTIGAVFDPKRVCNVIIEKAVAVIGAGKASVMLFNEKTGRLHLAAAYGLDLDDNELNKISVLPGEGVSGEVFSSGKHLLIENSANTLFPDIPYIEKPEAEASLTSARYKGKSFLSIPMMCKPKQTEQRVMGVINMTDKQNADMFTSGDLRLLTAIASQAAMSLYNIELIEEVKDAERVKREMEIAQQIQKGLLPGDPPSMPGMELAGRCLPATQVGGDYYDFFISPENTLGLVIADVSGHNVGAALMMAAARSTLRSEVLTRQSPSEILKNTNFVLYGDLTTAELFITMFYAEYDGNTRALRYSNGGHNHPIVMHQGVCSFLDTDGMLIGMLESVEFEEKTISLAPGDFVIFYTDGVVEAVNESGEMFKLARLCRVIERHGDCNAHQLLHGIYTALEEYSGNALGADDITVVVLKVH